ncbi:hypothetical protein H8M03_03985 [Sphingomonas sabuli]|uniref:MarR family transcriptional regulator n=1 Tax=Sphingomonas sabuli TaxID=2764186 RepID=A0A7G9L4F1_9SPHN|nr:hypothetical protein [Sphingomonas sabuli]QNM83500.1 hypothetical protein H8M03_03985 [Sphingomonas sabuli]
MVKHTKLAIPQIVAEDARLGPDPVRLSVELRLHVDDADLAAATPAQRKRRKKPSRAELVELAGKIYDARRLRDKLISDEIFGEPAWDILLACYCLPARGEILTVTSLSLVSAVPQSTGFRWQQTLTERGYLERGSKGADQRIVPIQLTEVGRELIEGYLTRLLKCAEPVLNCAIDL